MKLHTSVVGAVLLVSLAASAVAAPGSVSVTVTVDTTKPGPQIDRLAGEEHLRPRRQADHVARLIADGKHFAVVRVDRYDGRFG